MKGRATAAAPRAGVAESGGGLEVRHLRAFVALVDLGSMTAAARALGVAQSTVSEAVAALERVLGTPAVARRRGARGIALTTAGRALLPHARVVLSSLEEAHLAVAAATREVRAKVDLIANESVSTYLLPRALAILRERWPNTRFAVSVGTCEDVRRGLADGRFDAGVLLATEGPAADAGPSGEAAGPAGSSTPIADLALVLFCGREHPLARRPGHALRREVLAEYPVFSSDASGDFHALLARFFRAAPGARSRLESTGTVEAVKRNVLASESALGVLPAYAVAEELRAGLAHAVTLRPALPRVRLEVLLSRARPPRPVTVELVEVLQRLVENVPRGRAGAPLEPHPA